MTPKKVIAPGSVSESIWHEKYRLKSEDGSPIDSSIEDTFRRVAVEVARAEPKDNTRWAKTFYNAIASLEFIPAGRILAGAGTGRSVTLFNCYVMGEIEDSLEGIYQSLKLSALTLKQGGGIGMDFSSLRPRNALVRSVGSGSSGAVSFMHSWNTMCETIRSAGERRGAMMAVLRVDHPDILEFIKAKAEGGKLTNFNLSVGITDAFMTAVALDGPHELTFGGVPYGTVRARELWDQIMRTTYECADPGVVFIDRINETNPLKEVETIKATNPCGEQPLPPWGACLLGSINLARLVEYPFDPEARFDFPRIYDLTRTAVRFLDNVIDVSKYPLPEQEREAKNKRRIGLGITGLADGLAMLGLHYASDEGRFHAKTVMEAISKTAMEASQELAIEKGAYPFWIGPKDGPKRRNSHLTSIAPTGTISLFAGNVSSGIEPIFDLTAERNIRRPDGGWKKVTVTDYAYRLYNEMFHDAGPSIAFPTTADINPSDHLKMVAALQPFIDSSISKTINCPREIGYEDFKNIYTLAYELGLKGCTTYRPNDITGSILSSDKMTAEPKAKIKMVKIKMVGAGMLETMEGNPEPDDTFLMEKVSERVKTSEKMVNDPYRYQQTLSDKADLAEAALQGAIRAELYGDRKGRLTRAAIVHGSTYKIKQSGEHPALYVTINHTTDIDGKVRPVELFFNSKQVDAYEWMTALSRMISAVFRKGGDVEFIAEELQSVFSPKGGFWSDGKYVPSTIAAIGNVIHQHLVSIGFIQSAEDKAVLEERKLASTAGAAIGAIGPYPSTDLGRYQAGKVCPKCQRAPLIRRSGCDECVSCDYSKC